jgi:apolipoprotein N-acyltransferase
MPEWFHNGWPGVFRMSVSLEAKISAALEGVVSRPWRRHELTARLILTKVSLALLAALLLACSLPDPDVGWLAWIALVPLILACRGLHPIQAAGIGCIFAFVSGMGIYHWVFEIPKFGFQHFLLAGTYLAVYPTLWCAGVALMSRAGIALAFPAAALWVVLDYIRAHAGFLAFPWGTLAHTQHQNGAVLQIAAITGEYGVSFLVVLASASIAAVVSQRAYRSAAVAALIIAVAHGVGAYALYSETSGPTLRIAVVQPNTQIGEQGTFNGGVETFRRLERLTNTAAASQPALIAWPETSISGDLQSNPLLAADLQSLTRAIGIPIVLGVSEVQKFSSRDAGGVARRRAYNSAYLVSPGEPLAPPYRKHLLLPFGEYVPLEGILTWPAWIGGRGYDKAPGSGLHLFTLPDGTPFATLICWESFFSRLSRESVQGGARLLVQLNNPAWLGHTAAGKQQNLSSVFRAVENRVPVVLASNTGPSEIIDRYGRIVTRTHALFSEDIAVGNVTLSSGQTVYTQVGDVFVFVAFAGLVVGAVRRRATLT